ncbi:MAG: hypothetical protein GX683_07375 [Ruminococcaceae bacterium]|nr:hypothetical protein [Oscillospiraceae bacterium]
MKRFFKTAFTLAFALAAIFGGYSYIEERCLPDTVSVYAGEDFSYGRGFQLRAWASHGAGKRKSRNPRVGWRERLLWCDALPF